MKRYNGSWLIWLILLVAALLRLFAPFEIPFTHDEFSALFRTNFPSFHELIERGVKIDGHPAGIQVFLFYYTQWFGKSEFIVKLPFIFFGLGSVYFLYLLGKSWFNPTVGLVCASFLASLQYPVMYSQIARPYVSGLLLVLMMVYVWNQFVFRPGNRPYLTGIWYVLLFAACAYNHHFSLLLAIIVWISGLFLIRNRQIDSYLATAVIVLLLYAPHLPVFVNQLMIGGVGGWLGSPNQDFLSDYLSYVFHFSPFVILLVPGIIVFGLTRKYRGTPNRTYFILSFLWFFLPFIIGYLYSILVNPVLQYSVILFSFPFLLLFLFGHIPDLPVKTVAILTGIILLVNSASLILERKHYQIFYRGVYEQLLVNQHRSLQEFGDDCLAILDSEKKITQYYQEKLHTDSNFIWLSSFRTRHDFSNFLQGQQTGYLSYGCLSGTNPDFLSMIRDFYPAVIRQENLHGGTYYLFSSDPDADHQNQPVFQSGLDFEEYRHHWGPFRWDQVTDSLSFEGNYAYVVRQETDYCPGFSYELEQMMTHENDFIDVSVEVYPSDPSNSSVLVTMLQSNEKLLYWKETPVNSFMDQRVVRNTWTRVHHTIKLSDIDLSYQNITILVYLWNRDRTNVVFYIDDFRVRIIPGNPVIYGLFEKIF